MRKILINIKVWTFLRVHLEIFKRCPTWKRCHFLNMDAGWRCRLRLWITALKASWPFVLQDRIKNTDRKHLKEYRVLNGFEPRYSKLTKIKSNWVKNPLTEKSEVCFQVVQSELNNRMQALAFSSWRSWGEITQTGKWFLSFLCCCGIRF